MKSATVTKLNMQRQTVAQDSTRRKTTSWMFDVDTVENWCYWKNFLTKEECEKIVSYGNSLVLDQGTISNNSVDSNIRDSEIAWIHPNEETEWMFRRMTDVVKELNKKFFGFKIYGLVEGLQFTKYSSPSGFYSSHIDKHTGSVVRKLSISIQLSDEKSYKGGDLKLAFNDSPITAIKEQGNLVMFPSYVLHKVEPVTSGTRYSLVAWVTGPSFK